MKEVKVLICDVYRTILRVDEPAEDPEKRWKRLYTRVLRRTPELSLEQVALRCRQIISEDHSQARERGILYPEVNWPSVMDRALPELGALSRTELDEFLFNHAQLFRSLRIMPGCAEVFHECLACGILLGIASNAQAYTLKELEIALREFGLNLSIFEADLTFWSFEHGFSKPDPHVFEILRARLRNRALSESHALMIGDRDDKDITPARSAGWRTWQLSDRQGQPNTGNWSSLAKELFDSSA